MLTPRQTRFVAEYLVDLNGKQAAIRAGYSAKTAEQQASRLLSVAKVRDAVQAGKAAQLQATQIDARRVLEELARLATVDIRGFYDAAGNLKPIAELTPEQGAALAGVETVRQRAGRDADGNPEYETVRKVRLWDKVRALEQLAKHFGLLVDRVHVTGELEIVAGRLAAARKRLAAREVIDVVPNA